MHILEWNVCLHSAIVDPMCNIRSEFQQCFDRARRTVSGTQFEHLPEQNERNDDCSGLEVERGRAGFVAKRSRENVWHDGCKDGKQPRGACAECDQREHVETAIDDRLPATDEKR